MINFACCGRRRRVAVLHLKVSVVDEKTHFRMGFDGTKCAYIQNTPGIDFSQRSLQSIKCTCSHLKFWIFVIFAIF